VSGASGGAGGGSSRGASSSASSGRRGSAVGGLTKATELVAASERVRGALPRSGHALEETAAQIPSHAVSELALDAPSEPGAHGGAAVFLATDAGSAGGAGGASGTIGIDVQGLLALYAVVAAWRPSSSAPTSSPPSFSHSSSISEARQRRHTLLDVLHATADSAPEPHTASTSLDDVAQVAREDAELLVGVGAGATPGGGALGAGVWLDACVPWVDVLAHVASDSVRRVGGGAGSAAGGASVVATTGSAADAVALTVAARLRVEEDADAATLRQERDAARAEAQALRDTLTRLQHTHVTHERKIQRLMQELADAHGRMLVLQTTARIQSAGSSFANPSPPPRPLPTATRPPPSASHPAAFLHLQTNDN
jgi:hypothetical protein